MKENIVKSLALSRRDQFLAYFEDNKEDLQRINENGPEDQVDVDIVQKCVCFVFGEVCFSEDFPED